MVNVLTDQRLGSQALIASEWGYGAPEMAGRPPGLRYVGMRPRRDTTPLRNA